MLVFIHTRAHVGRQLLKKRALRVASSLWAKPPSLLTYHSMHTAHQKTNQTATKEGECAARYLPYFAPWTTPRRGHQLCCLCVEERKFTKKQPAVCQRMRVCPVFGVTLLALERRDKRPPLLPRETPSPFPHETYICIGMGYRYEELWYDYSNPTGYELVRYTSTYVTNVAPRRSFNLD